MIRVCSSLGHSNYLGNFLLYTTPLTLGLAFASKDTGRLLAGMAVLLSVAAIVFSGSRGAWLGIIIGIGVFATLELKAGAGREILANKRRLALVSAAAVVALAVAGFMISRSPSFRSVSERARTLMTEGLSSSGRVVLWRDSIRMIPRYALIGCGPEGFRKALLAYKSVELAALSPKANNESPHNAYLEAAISYGLLGAALYVLIIAYAIVLLWRARRNATSGTRRIVATGVIASFIAVLVHNFFIFDQIATGVYFFAFIAVAFVLPGTIGTKRPQDNVVERKVKPHPRKSGSTIRWRSLAVNSLAGVVVASSVWYCFGLFRAELAYKKLFDPLHPLDYQGMLQEGVDITNSPLPTGAYDFLYAGALEQAVQRIPTPSSTKPLQAKDAELAIIRSEVLKLGIGHAERSVKHTNTPDMNYSLLASLALAAGDVDKATAAAAKAVQWDPNNYYTRWLMAEAHLVRGENEQAIREAETSIKLYPRSLEAASTLSRARGGDGSDDTAAAAIIAQARNNRPNREHAAEELVEAARRISRSGNQQEARIKLLTAIGRSDGACPACHRELALVLEKMGRIKDAIAEWETYVKEDEAGAAAERVAARIESLRQRSETKP
ncbi:MAG TPA: O-antigen ligase family protein [Blastocatellia bacterium]|nr:O-antigen ligase family protein [Blastocatellia bacterium]